MNLIDRRTVLAHPNRKWPVAIEQDCTPDKQDTPNLPSVDLAGDVFDAFKIMNRE